MLEPYDAKVSRTVLRRGGRGDSSPLFGEAQHCAEKMGYHWIENTDPALQFEAFIFREFAISAITIKKIRHAIDENVFVEKLFPDEVEALRSLPLPPLVLRELWIRTQNERAWRRFYIF